MTNFTAWSHENLARFAREAYQQMLHDKTALAQLREDFKTAMQLLRELKSEK